MIKIKTIHYVIEENRMEMWGYGRYGVKAATGRCPMYPPANVNIRSKV